MAQLLPPGLIQKQCSGSGYLVPTPLPKGEQSTQGCKRPHEMLCGCCVHRRHLLSLLLCILNYQV